MYQTVNGKEWDTDLWQQLMMDKRIAFSSVSAEKRQKLAREGALPHLDNNYDWAMLCIAYCFATESHLPPKLKSAVNLQSSTGLHFTTCFQGKHKLWLAYISDALFEYKQAPCTQEDLYKYIQDLWHTGAVLLDEKWHKCREFKRTSLLEAKQLFLNELLDMVDKNAPSVIAVHTDNAVQDKDTQQKQFDRLEQSLRNMGLPIENLVLSHEGVRENIYRLSFSEYADLTKQHDKLCSNLGIDNVSLRIQRCTDGTPHSHYVFIRRDKNTWQTLGQKEFQIALRNYKDNFLIPVCLGVDEWGKPYFADLAVAPHVMIGGTTGSGKSVFVRSLLHSLFLLNQVRGKLEVTIVDGKSGADFSEFTDYENLYERTIFKPLDNDIVNIVDLLNEHLTWMFERQKLIAEYDVRHLSALPDNVRPPYLVLVLDEIGSLIEQDHDGELEKILVHLTAQGRALGIYVVLSTQRPDANTFRGQLRTNTPARIALKVGRDMESKIILGDNGAEKLAGYGDHLVGKWQDVPDKLFLHGFNI